MDPPREESAAGEFLRAKNSAANYIDFATPLPVALTSQGLRPTP
jgi:hypothetical protein